MNPQDSLRVSILVALGLHGCAGASQTSSSSDGSTAVVSIVPIASTSTPSDPVDPSEPGIPVIAATKTGWVTEENGNVHRGSIITCDPTIDMPACTGNERSFSCKTDSDCTAGAYGRCISKAGQIGPYCGCEYSCAKDSDCGEKSACVCRGIGRVGQAHAVCAEAKCSNDNDCERKQCGLSVYNNGCSTSYTLACRTREDECLSDKDCGNAQGQCVQSRRPDSNKWECAFRNCAIGRPLVVAGKTQSASPKVRPDWKDSVDFDVDHLDAEMRLAAANHYAEVAAMEHASVASFARFSLQLLALGAPAELLQEAHRAAIDEIEHARMAYALASVFGKKDVGPGTLPAALAPMAAGIAEFVEALVEEGCVGETLGAAEAREAAQQTTLPRMAAVLTTIAEDEERHAALAWRTLQWALESFGDVARDAAEKAFAKARMTYCHNPLVPVPIENLGIFSGYQIGTLRRHVLLTVVGPCARALGINIRLGDVA